MAMAFNIKVS